MSEKKYYVGLKVLIDGNVITHFLWKDHCFYRGFEKSRCSFTKSELAEIADGTLYRKPVNMDSWTPGFQPIGYIYNRSDKTYEFINPLIELVPVEELRC